MVMVTSPPQLHISDAFCLGLVSVSVQSRDGGIMRQNFANYVQRF